MPHKQTYNIRVQYDPAGRTALTIPVREGVANTATRGTAYEGARGGFGFADKTGAPVYKPNEDVVAKEQQGSMITEVNNYAERLPVRLPTDELVDGPIIDFVLPTLHSAHDSVKISE